MHSNFIDVQKHPQFFEPSMQIYRDSFEQEEREDEESIKQNIERGVYKMLSYISHDEVIGFYILDINQQFDYVLFSFLAIKKSWQKRGLGTKLSLHAINYFQLSLQENFLLTEAKERQAKLYKKLEFSTIKLEYLAPLFDSDKSIAMNLMLIEKKKRLNSLILKNIIKDMFYRGYGLEENDKRVLEQLNKVSI